jgi:phosphatidylserine/phosphatidylglycerophosphate/cardiolipin synthase-like enzyme
MRRLCVLIVLGPALIGTAVVLAGCQGLKVKLDTGPTKHSSTHSKTHSKSSPTGTAIQAAGPVSAGSGALRVLAEPQAGLSAIYKLINGAKSSIELTMYELRDSTAEGDLAAAAKRGVDVRVILDAHLEQSRNTATYNFLRGHGVHVTWAPSGTTYHQKTLTVDNRTSVIMTLNMVSADYAGTRDFAVFDTSKSDVAAVVATFNADYAHRAITPPDGADLVWSPTNSQAAILAVIGSAKKTLAVEN